MKLTFGKYKDQDTTDVPLGYLKWLEEQDWLSDSLRDECNYEIARREGDRPGVGKERKPNRDLG